ncbi:MAG: sulfatase-like hydrolase/transferase [Verrucomicrobiales bacterium]
MKTLSAILTVCLAFAIPPVQANPGPPKPNILILFADDLGYADLGVQGARDIPTPHIDSIARNGVRCSSGYVSSAMCSPSRAGLLTGRSQSRFGHDINWEPEWPVDPNDHRGLPLTEKTIADHLKAAGYRTGIVGKWHLGEAPPFHPNRRGFDEFVGFIGGGHNYFTEHYRSTPPLNHYNTVLEKNGVSQPAAPGYLTTLLGEESAAFIHRHKEKPWFLYTAFNAPHTPLQATPELLERVKHIGNDGRRTYAAMIVGMDDAVGRILRQLRDDGLEENTIVFFLSDNGGTTENGTSSNLPLRGRKGQMWEGGIRVPFLAQWKTVLPAGKTYERPVTSMDILPTSLAAAGGTSVASQALDGVNLLPFLTGEKSGDPHDLLFWRIAERDIWAVRGGDHKFVKEGDKFRLFDLSRDVGETTDLAEKLPEIRGRLQKAHDEWSATLTKPLWRVFKSPEQEAAFEERAHKKNQK